MDNKLKNDIEEAKQHALNKGFEIVGNEYEDVIFEMKRDGFFVIVFKNLWGDNKNDYDDIGFQYGDEFGDSVNLFSLKYFKNIVDEMERS